MNSLSFGDRSGRLFWRMVPKRALSGVIGWWGRQPQTEQGLDAFARKFGIDPGEAEKPLGAYAFRDDFFTRKLKPGARPIASGPGQVVHPSDGTVVECGLAHEGQLIQAKGISFQLEDLLADAPLAARLTGGAYLITYLSPRDYHRVHSPVAGRILGWRHVPGDLFSVNAASVRREAGLFARNERLVIIVQGDAGLCVVVMVAAVGVGHITAAFDPDVRTHDRDFARGPRRRDYDDPRPVELGGELGTFHLGSTTIAVFEPGKFALDPHAPASKTRMGARLGQVQP